LNESVDVTDSLGTNIYINHKDSEIFRILPKSNAQINENILSDKTRFYYDSNLYNRISDCFKYHQKKKVFKPVK
jgi:NADH dehydrogenase (ubiquinone) Fe-S protein 1